MTVHRAKADGSQMNSLNVTSVSLVKSRAFVEEETCDDFWPEGPGGGYLQVSKRVLKVDEYQSRSPSVRKPEVP